MPIKKILVASVLGLSLALSPAFLGACDMDKEKAEPKADAAPAVKTNVQAKAKAKNPAKVVRKKTAADKVAKL